MLQAIQVKDILVNSWTGMNIEEEVFVVQYVSQCKILLAECQDRYEM